MQKKKIVAVALAGFMAFGAASVSLGSVSEAAHHKQVEQHHYEDGTTNEYSHRMKEEDKLHTQNVRTIRYEYRKDGDQKKYDRALEKEQKRHDKVVKEIKADSEAHIRHTHQN